MIKLIIRRADEKDLDNIYNIELASFKNPYSRQYLKLLINTSSIHFLIAEKNNRVLGYITGIKENENGHIISIAVLPKFRKQGIGQRLLISLLAKFKEKGVRKVRLEVRKTNIPAISFYMKNGFRIVETIERYYPDREDCYVMEKEI